MRRLILSVTVALLAMALIPVVGSAKDSGSSSKPRAPKADGSGFSPTFGLIHVNAELSKKGARGHFDIKQARAHGRVTCVNVVGNTAFVGGVDRRKGGFLIYVEDNGRPGRNRDRHAFEPTAAPPTTQAACADPALAARAQVITRGNYRVRAGRP